MIMNLLEKIATLIIYNTYIHIYIHLYIICVHNLDH